MGVSRRDPAGCPRPRRGPGKRNHIWIGIVTVSVLALGAEGCAQNETGLFSDGYAMPIIRSPQRVRNEIVKSEDYWIQKEVQVKEEFPGPTAADLKAPETDYILGPGDLIDVTVHELIAMLQPHVTRQRISQTGVVTLPYIGTVKCAGLTTQGLEGKLADMLEPDYLVNPQVSVFVAEYRNLQVSLLNGVMRPGIYPLQKLDMNLLELVAEAGGVLQMTEDYGYIIRKYAPEETDLLLLEGGAGQKEAPAGAPEKEKKGAPKETRKKPPAPAEEGKAPPAEGQPPAPAEPKAPPPAAPENKAPPATEPKAPAPAGTEPKAPPPAAPESKAPPATEPKAPPPAAPESKAPPATEPKAPPPAELKPPAPAGTEGKAPGGTEPKGPPPKNEKPPASRPGKESGPPAPTGAQGSAPKEGAEAKPPAPAPKDGTAAPAAKEGAPKTPSEAEKAAAREALEKMAEGEATPAKKAEAAEPGGKAAPGPAAEEAPKDAEELGRWVWSNGKWVEVKPEKPAQVPQPPEAKPPETKPPETKPPETKPPETKPPETKPPETKPPETKPPETKPPEAKPGEAPPALSPERLALEKKLRRLGVVQGSGQLRRIIRFDVQSLQAGDPTQNVVVRDGDIITIPSPPVGDFYMAGEVARPGVYSLTGRKITLLQAVAAAGGLSAVAVPWRTEVVRRSSETEEEIIYVDLSRIARGDAPDFYMQADDLVRVGTDQGAVFNAVLRNAFRATYGLGAVYDTNFAEFYPWRRTPRPFINR